MNTPTLLDAAIIVAAQAHAGQRRKYTDRPYLEHCLEVVGILIDQGVEEQRMLAAAALHDVLEDTPMSEDKVTYCLSFRTRIPSESVHHTMDLVTELTEPAHEGNRATRKAAERERLSKVSPEAQTIKYADLISNTGSIATHDPNFAKVYLQEKWDLLKVMTAGDQGLLSAARLQCYRSAESIGMDLVY